MSFSGDLSTTFALGVDFASGTKPEVLPGSKTSPYLNKLIIGLHSGNNMLIKNRRKSYIYYGERWCIHLDFNAIELKEDQDNLSLELHLEKKRLVS